MPVVLPPASSSATCEPGYCSWSIPSIFNLETRAWTDDTQFTVVCALSWVFLCVGGGGVGGGVYGVGFWHA
jgi:hypothetical protein